MSKRTILHCDVTNLYASVEICKNPSLYGKPIAVCGDPEKRHGIILAKSYPAKAYGIKTGDVIWEALKKCPKLILLPADYVAYMKYSELIFDIYTNYTDKVEPYGLDECWLDVTGSLKLFGTGKELADMIRERVTKETGLTISAGVSFTKAFAKLGSDIRKPDATTVIARDNYRNMIWDMPVSDLIMVGRQTAKKLNKFNINTIGELARADRDLLQKTLGIVGLQLINSANGVEESDVRYYYEPLIPKSVGHSTTTPRDMITRSDVKSVIFALSDQIAYRLRKSNLSAQGVSLYTRNRDLVGFSRQRKLDITTNNGLDIGSYAMELFDNQFTLDVPLRAIGISTFNLDRVQDIIQTGFFDNERFKKNQLDLSLDKVRSKYGIHSIKRAVELQHDDITDIFDDTEFKPFKR